MEEDEGHEKERMVNVGDGRGGILINAGEILEMVRRGVEGWKMPRVGTVRVRGDVVRPIQKFY